MKLSAGTSYALQSLILLARCEKRIPVSTSRLAIGDMPRRFLPQVLHKLVEHGVLISTAGQAGGYFLARAPRSITLLEIMEAVEGTFSIAIPRIPSLSKEAQQHLTSSFLEASDLVRERLRAITLAELVCVKSNDNDGLSQNDGSWSAPEKREPKISIQLDRMQQPVGVSL